MKIAIITDAWHPQVNGVVRTLTHLRAELTKLGHQVLVVSPDLFPNVPCPGYSEIRLAYRVKARMRKMVLEFAPEAVHISTEGPLGQAARKLCIKEKISFTTAYHTRFPEYLKAKLGVPEAWTRVFLRRFHAQSKCIMVPTPSMQADLELHGFKNVRQWTRGVDTELFKPLAEGQDRDFLNLPRPIFAYVGRVSVEKNIGAFLSLPLPGSKLVVGDGPEFKAMREKYPRAHFVGAKRGEELAAHYAAADVFVFPSKTDTFGLVVLEALASGVPVAAYPVTGPRDIIGDASLVASGALAVGALSEDLLAASLGALHIDSDGCRRFALSKSWAACAEQFVANLHKLD
jgi:glycosyltransferase involved in cell wall biosynthesis